MVPLARILTCDEQLSCTIMSRVVSDSNQQGQIFSLNNSL